MSDRCYENTLGNDNIVGSIAALSSEYLTDLRDASEERSGDPGASHQASDSQDYAQAEVFERHQGKA
jgi:hypothetical protein